MSRAILTATGIFLAAAGAWAQTAAPAKAAPNGQRADRPKLVVVIVVDQMRADYVDRFRSQWSGGLKRLLDEGAWFRSAAYPYAATETCVGHSTISTGAFPSEHGMISNAWFDRESQKMITCTSDPNVQNIAYAGGTTKGGDSAWRMQLPSFAEELKFQSGGGTRVVTFSLKARTSIPMAGHQADVATWFDTATGAWVTSSAYATAPFVEEYARKHPVAGDFGKIWSLSRPAASYVYEDTVVGGENIEGWGQGFPHRLAGKGTGGTPDEAFYEQWATSPYLDTYLTRLGEAAVDSMKLGRTPATDYLGISYSAVDYVGHAFGPRSREIQDILIRLDKDLGELFSVLDQKVGRGKYVVALSADHGVAPIPGDMKKSGVDAGFLDLTALRERMEQALVPFKLPKPAIARIAGNSVYFAPGVYLAVRQDLAALHAVVEAARTTPGVAAVYGAEELAAADRSLSETRTAFAWDYFAGRSGDLFVLQKAYWLTETPTDPARVHTGTSHGTPYFYDQRVPILLMGFGIKPGEYFEPVTPADIAPTLGALTAVTLATRDGRVLREALQAQHAR